MADTDAVTRESAIAAIEHVAQHNCDTREREAVQMLVAAPEAWIDASVELPKSGVIVLACYRNSLGKLRRIRAQWVAAKTQEAHPETDGGEYDEDADAYWTPEGWYECIDNWDEYSSVVCEGKVTHWMPLPPPPAAQEAQ